MQNDNSKLKINEKKDHEEKKSEEKKEDKGIEELKRKVVDLENSWKRAVADYQNLEKRTVEEKREWLLTANKHLLLRLLPISDTLMLAGKHSQDQSLKVSISQFLDVLEQEGVVRIETKDKDFDPTLMEGIKTVAGDENKVVEELRPGFKMGDQVLRPAQVSVGKKGDSETSSE